MDILVRNTGVPEGRLLSVSSALLPGGLNGTRCAVTVFHDISAERRRRDELAAFAGVVAHDLLNPLATVEGWTESLTDALDDGPGALDAGQAHDGLIMIGRASRRMRGMIDDLLEYTIAWARPRVSTNPCRPSPSATCTPGAGSARAPAPGMSAAGTTALRRPNGEPEPEPSLPLQRSEDQPGDAHDRHATAR
nr:histidine kinase dimerization/phospho-acceptor domain-containing protein [Actinoplanes polyasparticus]